MNETPAQTSESNKTASIDQMLMVDDLALFALQSGPQTSSKVAKLFGISNLEAKAMLRRQCSAGYVVEKNVSGSRLFRLSEPEEMSDLDLED